MPIGDFVNSIPRRSSLLIHLVAFSAGAYFAWRACADAGTLGWAFTLFALAEISYMTLPPRLDRKFFAHTLSEVLDLLAFVLVFIAATSGVTANAGGEPRGMTSRNLMARAALGAALGLTLLLGACAAAPVEPVATDQVDLPPSYRFEPEVITVADGTTVTWTNHDNFTHNVRLLDDGGDTMETAPGESVSARSP